MGRTVREDPEGINNSDQFVSPAHPVRSAPANDWRWTDFAP
jgi:hypothetical protein